MRGLLSFLAAAAVAVAFPLTAGAQPQDRLNQAGGSERAGEAERLGGPLRPLQRRLKSGTPLVTFSTMMVGPATTARPEAPVEAWFWTFSEKELQVSVPGVEFRYDSMAMRYRVDCAAGTIQMLRRESYRNGVLVRAASPPTEAEKPGVLTRHRFNAVCEPGFAVDAPTFDDHRAARAGYLAYLAGLRERGGSADAPAAAAKPVRTGEAERSGPLRGVGTQVGARPDAVGMMSGPLPSKRPAAPVEVWSWTFWRDERGEGDLRHDTLAVLMEVDCNAGTARSLLTEAYRDGAFVAAEKTPGKPLTFKPGTLGHARLRTVCEPGFNPNAPTYPDHRAARAAAMKDFARGEAERAGGPLRMVGTNAGITIMIAGRGPAKRPAAPFDAWVWYFWHQEQKGKNRYDTLAIRQRVDCAARTVQVLGGELYRSGTLVETSADSRKPEAGQPGSLRRTKIRMACEPGFRAKAAAYPNHTAARAAALKQAGRRR